MANLENKLPKAPQRGPRGQLLPGHTANPGGRPKGIKEVEALAREKTEACILGLAAIAEDPTQPAAARVSAFQTLLDRAWGKAKQAIVAEAGEGILLGVVMLPAKGSQ